MTTQTQLTRQDLKIFPSENLTDLADGGGLPTNTPITGADGEVFDPVARLDNISGDLSIRSIFAGLSKANDTPLYKSFFAIAEPPTNPAVTYLANPSDKFGETRKEMVKDIESSRVTDYIYSPTQDLEHLERTNVIEIHDFTLADDPQAMKAPAIGDVLYLEAEYLAQISEIEAQKKFKYGEYVKVEDVELIETNYAIDIDKAIIKTYQAVRITTTKTLQYSYNFDYLLTKDYTSVDEASFKHTIYSTKIIENQRYYGVQPIVNSITKDDMSITVPSVTSKIAPVINDEVIEVDGINVLRLPQNGDVEILQKMDKILISNHVSEDIGSAHTGGQTVQLSRTNVDRICLRDDNQTPINAELWDYDLVAGTITWATTLDLSPYTMPITAHNVQEEANRILNISNNTLNLQFKCLRDYPLDGTYVSSIVETGTLQVWHSQPFTQRNWDGEWRDTPQGDQLLNKLNLSDYPIQLTGNGTITERYLFKFVDDTNFEFYGERLGFIGRFDRLQDFSPINQATGQPLLTIPKEAFGSTDVSWSAQDVIRLNTKGTLVPIRLIRVVQPNRNEQTESDGIKMCLFGDTTEITN